jgi:tetratricopeptide (TPR) repeat protein
MIGRINRFVIVLLIVGLALGVVLLNRDATTIHLGGGTIFTANTGVILIVAFGAGVVCAGIVSIFFGFKAYLRERALRVKDRQRSAFYEAMMKARGYLALGEWQKARAEWEKLSSRDPANIVARVELSRSLEGMGDPREALKVLDGARVSVPDNAEVLLRAAELNLVLNNRTAALDNLALIIAQRPSRKALTLARDLSEELDRIEDALEYQNRLEELSPGEDAHRDAIARLEFKKIVRDAGADVAKLRDELKVFIKRNPGAVPALEKLAALEVTLGHPDDAAQLLVKAGKASGQTCYWHSATKLWSNAHLPDKALAAARNATKETRGLARLEAEVLLTKTYLALNMFEEAKAALKGFTALAAAEEVTLPDTMSRQIMSLEGLCLSRLGDSAGAAEIWQRLADNDISLTRPFETAVGVNGDAPAARLSTP